MYDGIYEVSFVSPRGQDYGVGIVTIKDGAINGGDEAYMYAGRLHVQDDGKVIGRIRVSKWSLTLPSVIPGYDNYELDFHGEFHDGDSLDGRADVVGNPALWLTVTAHKHAEAA
jgi:hypothetical protein